LSSPRLLPLFLRVYGAIDLVALAAVVAPREQLAAMHAAMGLGTLPEGEIVVYLARAMSALCAMYGAVLIYLSLDVVRNANVIRFLAVAAIVHGTAMLVVDLREGMPWWWTAAEGPTFALAGATILVLARWELEDA
jgi:hypothetical protein